MKPVRFAGADFCYRGPTEEIGDLWVHRVRAGHIIVAYQPSDEEVDCLVAGGRVELQIFAEPIPPIALNARPPDEYVPVRDHPFKSPWPEQNGSGDGR